MNAVGIERPLLEVEGLVRRFDVRTGIGGRQRQIVHALDGVSFSVADGSTLGIVGESGCGKSTLARCVVRLLEPHEGRITFDGADITHLNRAALRPIRRQIGMVFQDPYTSLDPRMTVAQIVAEPLEIAGAWSSLERDARVRRLLDLVGLRSAALARYPYEFSGGQRQIGGPKSDQVEQPRLLLCDEPVSALDVSIQAQILNLLADLQTELRLTMIIISHNLEVVRHLADRVLVMYLGTIVEDAPMSDVFQRPDHPYTAALLASMLSPVVQRHDRRPGLAMVGEPPSPLAPPTGCRFHPRCPRAIDRCATEVPLVTETELGSGRTVRCHLPLGS